MKKIKIAFLFLILFSGINFSYAQVKFFQSAIRTSSGNTTIYSLFKKNTTVFICPKALEDDMNDIKQLLKEQWTLTPVRVVGYDSANYFYGKSAYNLFMMKGDCIFQGTMPLNYNFNFSLSVLNGKDDDGNWDYQDIARMVLAPVDTFLNNCTKGRTKLMKKYDVIADMNQKGAFYNFSYADVALFIKCINYYFTNNKPEGPENVSELVKLKTATLYVPYYEAMDIKMNAMNGRQTHDLTGEDKAFKKYAYTWKKINSDELKDLVNQSSDNYYMTLTIQTSGYKWFQVINTKTGEIVFDSNNTSKPGEIFQSSLVSIGMLSDLDIKRITEKMGK